LDWKADLVVLLASETARPRVSKGEGMLGLTRALFVAPAASSWATDIEPVVVQSRSCQHDLDSVKGSATFSRSSLLLSSPLLARAGIDPH
jgi:hypothetical protein